MAWLTTKPLWPALLADVAQGRTAAVMAARFHKGLARSIVAMVAHLTEVHVNPWQGRVALSGGVFQNAILMAEVTAGLTRAGLTVYTHSRIPTNDGGLALGQAVVAAARTLRQ